MAKHPKASLVLALALTACGPAQPTGTAPSSTPSAGASASASASPGASTAPTSTPSAAASAAATATAVPTAAPTKFVVLSGTVYDESGAPVDGATVSINSLDQATPYKASTTTNQGSYVISNLPEGVNVEIIATKPNWTSRRRVNAFQAAATALNDVNFGGPLSETTDSGAAYFISKYPEVSMTAPAYGADALDPSTITSYQLTLSEPLDIANRNRFEAAIRVLPANALASPTGPTTDLQDLADAAQDFSLDDPSQFAYEIKAGSLFLAEPNTRASITWDSTNTVATLSFNAPLLANKNDAAKYQIALVAGDTPIVDPFNNQLGTDLTGSLKAFPATGKLLRHVFLPNQLAINGNPADGNARWAATHQDASHFTLLTDTTLPYLTGVTYAKNLGTDSRFELTFDEPMAAYNGTSIGREDASLSTGAILDTYTMTVSDHVGGTAHDILKGSTNGSLATFAFAGTTPALDSSTDLWGTSSGQLDQEFKLDKAAFTPVPRTSLLAASDTGKITVEVNPMNAKQVFIYIFNRTDVFDSRIQELKARVDTYADPAGNVVKELDGDNHQVTGTF